MRTASGWWSAMVGRGSASVTVGSGTVPVRAPRVNDKRVEEESGKRKRFSSRILPAYARRSPKVTEVLPILYLHGLSTGDFGPALRDLLGEDASGLSPSSIQRLTEQWQAEHAAFRTRELRFHRYAYLFVDGVQRQRAPRRGSTKPRPLVVIGVREDGEKELLAVEDGYRESDGLVGGRVPRSARPRAQRAEAGDWRRGARRVGGAARRIPRRQESNAAGFTRLRMSSTRSRSGCSPGPRALLHEMAEAPSRADARKALERFRSEFDAKYPKAVAKLDKDWDALTAFYDFPAEHWRHPQDDEPDREQLRDRQAPHQGHQGRRLQESRARDGLQAARRRPGALAAVQRPRARHRVPAGVKFKDGIKVTDDDTTTTDEKVAA